MKTAEFSESAVVDHKRDDCGRPIPRNAVWRAAIRQLEATGHPDVGGMSVFGGADLKTVDIDEGREWFLYNMTPASNRGVMGQNTAWRLLPVMGQRGRSWGVQLVEPRGRGRTTAVVLDYEQLQDVIAMERWLATFRESYEEGQ